MIRSGLNSPVRRGRLTAVLVAAALVAASCSDDDDGGSATAPEATDAPATDAPAADPPATEAPAADPAGTEPPATEAPPSTRPPVMPEDVEPCEGLTIDPVDATATAAASGPWSVAVVPSPYSTITAAVTVESEAPVQVEVTASSGDHLVEVPRTAAVTTEHVVPVAGMRSESDYELTIDLFGEDGSLAGTEALTFTTGALPEWFIDYEFEIDPERSSPGITLVEVNRAMPPEEAPSSQYLMGLDEEGEVVWYYQNTGVIGGVELTPGGTFLSHYWPFGVREFDLLGNVVGNWQFQPDVSDTVDVVEAAEVIDQDLLNRPLSSADCNLGDPEPIPVGASWVELITFHHEAWPMPNGNILTMSTTNHDLTPEQREAFCPGDTEEFGIVSDVMVEYEPNGRVVRTWDLWDVLDIDEVPGDQLCVADGFFASEGLRDWTHGNAAIYDPERDAIIVSSRHTNQVVAFKHLDDEGPQTELLWVFGEQGTIPLDGDVPYYQHAVEVQADGSILLYDNGNKRPGTEVGDPDNPTYSRAVIYDVDDTSDDPADWSVTQVWEHQATEDDGTVVYARFIGDADRVDNGNVLITHGGIDPANADLPGFLHALLIEVVPDGESGGDVVWKLELGTEEIPATVYRSERVASLYSGPDWVERS